MTYRSLKIAGWLAMASAFLTLPLVYISYVLEKKVDTEAIIFLTIIQVSGAILYIAIVAYFKKLLNIGFKFGNINRNLDLMIQAEVITAVLAVVGLYVTPWKESIGYAVLVVLVVQGLIQAQMGFKLLKLPNELDGLLKPFCYANIATGILLASIVLIPLGILASAISDLMLGTIFLNIAKLTRKSGVKNGGT